jgi:hypothetical protein
MVRFGKALAALAVGVGLAAGSAARANVVFLDVGSMDHPRVVHIAGIGNVYDAPMQFKAIENGKQVNLLAWCVDVYHEITLKDYVPNLAYTDTNTLSTDFGGHPLDPGDAWKIGVLANYGQDVFDDLPTPPPAFTQTAPKRSDFPPGAAGTAAYNAAKAAYNAAKAAHNAAVSAYNAAVSTRYMRLSAVQAAIWQVASNRNVTSNDSVFDQLVDNLSGAHLENYFFGGYAPEGSAVTLITPIQQYGGRNGRTPLALTQSFVIAKVPEPATWAMLIGGCGLAGAALRRQRKAAATVA